MFIINSNINPIDGVLIYNYTDKAFDTKDRNVSGISSLLINSLQIELDEAGRLLYVWGYSPFEAWKAERLSLPTCKETSLFFEGKLPVPGSSKKITKEDYIPILYDKSKNLICIGNHLEHLDAIKFAPGAVAILKAGEINALWLSFTSC